MKNYELHNYRAKPICDMHMHPHVEAPLEESVEIYKDVCDHFNYEKIVLQALPYYEPINNYKTLYFKARDSRIYANLGRFHNYDERDTKEFYENQIKTFYDMGCDGIKLYEGKPECRKVFGRSLCDPVLDKFYEFCEEKQLPMVMHFGDPREFWDINKIPKWALERGWLYDSSFVHFDALQKEVEGILEKFPKLQLVLAHFFFVSDDIDYATRFMDKWENVTFDLTPGTEMFFNFNDKPDEWKAFFLKYADRILYGSDIYNWHREGKTVEEKYSHAVNLVRSFLEKNETFVDKWTTRTFDHPFGFSDDILDKIYHDNMIRIFGENPRPLDGERIVFELKRDMPNLKLNEVTSKNAEDIIAFFSK